jgi:hypothetical protein
MLVMPLAAMKIVAEKYAQRAGHGEAVVVGLVIGSSLVLAGDGQGLGRCFQHLSGPP